jgi:hypothetical protein
MVYCEGQHVQQAGRLRVLPDVHAADGHRDDFRLRCIGRCARLLQVFVLAAAHQQARLIGLAGDGQQVLSGDAAALRYG